MSVINFDNKSISIMDHGDQELIDSLRFVFKMFNISKIGGADVIGLLNRSETIPCLLLAQYVNDDAKVKFPINITNETAIIFTQDWLKSTQYPERPDFDGDVIAGFRIEYRDFYYGVALQNVIMIMPTWALYGK